MTKKDKFIKDCEMLTSIIVLIADLPIAIQSIYLLHNGGWDWADIVIIAFAPATLFLVWFTYKSRKIEIKNDAFLEIKEIFDDVKKSHKLGFHYTGGVNTDTENENKEKEKIFSHLKEFPIVTKWLNDKELKEYIDKKFSKLHKTSWARHKLTDRQ